MPFPLRPYNSSLAISGTTGRPPHFEVQRAGALEHGVTDFFRQEPAAIKVGKVEVCRIMISCLFGSCRTLPVHAGGHDQFGEFLEGPAVIGELRGEPFQQFGMGRLPPRWPKSLGVAIRPCAKWYCHTRLTITRAVSGLSLLAIQFASALRLPVVVAS